VSDRGDDLESIDAQIAVLEDQLALPELDAMFGEYRDAETALRRAELDGRGDVESLRTAWMKALARWNRAARSHQGFASHERLSLLTQLRQLRSARARIVGDVYQEPLVFTPGDVHRYDTVEDITIRPSASGSGELFMQSEFGSPYVAFGAEAVRPAGDEVIADLGLVAISFTPARPLPLWGVAQATFGYPNEEAFRQEEIFGPGFHGIGTYEVFNTDWQERVVRQNRYAFPWTPDDLGLHHYRLAFKENTLDVLASGLRVWGGLDNLSEAIELYRSLDPSWQ
jgi:hypothetical protein